MRRAGISPPSIASACFAQSQQRPAITGIAFVRMYAADAAASANFYGKTLGYDHTTRDGMTVYSVNDAQSLEVVPLPSPAPQARVAAIGFTTRNAAALLTYLKAHSVKIDQPLRHGRFAVRDPEGHLVYFVQQRPVSTKKISPRRCLPPHHPYGISGGGPGGGRCLLARYSGLSPLLVWRAQGRHARLREQPGAGRYRLDRVHAQQSGPIPIRINLAAAYHFSLGVAHMSDAVAALARNHCEGAELHQDADGARWQGAAQSLRSRPDARRVHGVPSLGQDLLLAVYRVAAY